VVSGTVLVTGATGGLGRVLAATLHAQGRAVIATGRNPAVGAELAAQGIRFIPADLAHDPLAPLVEGVESIFHLAALSAPWGAYKDFVAANVSATTRLIAAAKAAGCRRLVFASTPSVYTAAVDQIGLTEASPLPRRFANAYALTKHAAECAVLDASDAQMATVALRPRAIIGPYDTVLLPRLLRAAEKGVLPLPAGGRALIEPTDARDVEDAFLAAEAALPGIAGRVFNISGGVPLPVETLARHVFARLGRKVQIVGVPRRLALAGAGALERGARLMPGQPEPVLTRYSAMVLGWSQTFDLSAARSLLRWEPRRAPLAAVDWALEEMRVA
jgi:2-alkyl-3-oxoalkanoate reductase